MVIILSRFFLSFILSLFMLSFKMNKDIPSNAKPYSIDIKSMYSNIIIEEGLEAFEEALEKKA